jgi:hypothetical protein
MATPSSCHVESSILRFENSPESQHLSGLVLDVLHMQAGEKFAPTDHRQLLATRDVMQRVRDAGSQLLGRYMQTIAKKDSPEARAAAQLKKFGSG